MDNICPICLNKNNIDTNINNCEICEKNNCKIHDSCINYATSIGYNYDKCYICNSVFNNNNNFFQISLQNLNEKNLNTIHLIKNESINNININKQLNLPDTISSSSFSSTNTNNSQIDVLVFNIDSPNETNKYYCFCKMCFNYNSIWNFLYYIFICFLLMFIGLCFYFLLL